MIKKFNIETCIPLKSEVEKERMNIREIALDDYDDESYDDGFIFFLMQVYGFIIHIRFICTFF